MEELKCVGCGSVLQSTNQSQPGYVPKSKLNDNTDDLLCRRCFRIKHYNEVVKTTITKDDFTSIISEIGNTNSIIVNIIDIFDIEGSLIPQISRLTNNNDLYIIANKVDLLPKAVREGKLKHHLKAIISQNDLKPKDIFIMSATKNKNIDLIMAELSKSAGNKDIYVVGATNVGKSTFINTLLKSYANSKDDVITVSQVPGTTLDFIKIPFNDSFIYDTPGLINDHQITHNLSQEAIKTITPKKEIKPKVYQLNPKQSLFLGGLARIDFIQGDKTSFIVYASQTLQIHRTKLEKADDLQKNRIKELLTPPFKNDDDLPLKRTRFTLKGPHKKDIVLPSVGFITITGKALIDVYVSKKTTPYVRKALI